MENLYKISPGESQSTFCPTNMMSASSGVNPPLSNFLIFLRIFFHFFFLTDHLLLEQTVQKRQPHPEWGLAEKGSGCLLQIPMPQTLTVGCVLPH